MFAMKMIKYDEHDIINRR